MAVILTCTITATCWKQHTCCACGCVFRYLLTRTVKASGGRDSDVRAKAEIQIGRKLVDDVDCHPCPCCGTVQPDMVGGRNLVWHTGITLTAVLLAVCIILPTFQGVLPLDIAGKVLAALAAVAALAHVVTALRNPNRNRARNLSRVQADVMTGTMLIMRGGEEPRLTEIPRNLTIAHVLGLLGVLIAPLAFFAVVYVSEQYPMPRNAGLHPDVVGPGDDVTIPLPPKIRSVGGFWRGTAVTAQVLNAAEFGIPATLRARTNKKSWGNMIAVKNAKHPYEPTDPWVQVTIPADADLGGKTLHLKVTLSMSYPTPGGSRNFGEQTGTVERAVNIVLAEAGADSLYRASGDIGKWVGLGGCLLGGALLALLANQLRRRALPNDALPLDAPTDGRVIASGAVPLQMERLVRDAGR